MSLEKAWLLKNKKREKRKEKKRKLTHADTSMCNGKEADQRTGRALGSSWWWSQGSGAGVSCPRPSYLRADSTSVSFEPSDLKPVCLTAMAWSEMHSLQEVQHYELDLLGQSYYHQQTKNQFHSTAWWPAEPTCFTAGPHPCQVPSLSNPLSRPFLCLWTGAFEPQTCTGSRIKETKSGL